MEVEMARPPFEKIQDWKYFYSKPFVSFYNLNGAIVEFAENSRLERLIELKRFEGRRNAFP